jgi:hypothetical protein
LSRNPATAVARKYRYMVGPAGFHRAMARLAELTRKEKIPVLILYAKAGRSQRSLIKKLSQEYGFWRVHAVPSMRRYFVEHKIPWTKEERVKRLALSSGDPHPNEFGHTMYSNALFGRVNKIISARLQRRD